MDMYQIIVAQEKRVQRREQKERRCMQMLSGQCRNPHQFDPWHDGILWHDCSTTVDNWSIQFFINSAHDRFDHTIGARFRGQPLDAQKGDAFGGWCEQGFGLDRPTVHKFLPSVHSVTGAR